MTSNSEYLNGLASLTFGVLSSKCALLKIHLILITADFTDIDFELLCFTLLGKVSVQVWETSQRFNTIADKPNSFL